MHASEAEIFGTKALMAELCPPRSGDQKLIYWADKSKDELYHEDYCSLAGMIKIITAALEVDDGLREAAASGANVFLRNVQTFVDAVEADDVDSLQMWVPPREDQKLKDVLVDVLEEAGRQEGHDYDDNNQEPNNKFCSDDMDDSENHQVDGKRLLFPRIKNFSLTPSFLERGYGAGRLTITAVGAPNTRPRQPEFSSSLRLY